jgi:hypothetical protein
MMRRWPSDKRALAPAVGAALLLLAGACKKPGSMTDNKLSSQRAAMTSKQICKLPPDLSTPTSMALTEQGSVWIADGTPRMLRCWPDGRVTSGPEVLLGGSRASVLFIAAHGADRLWLIVDDAARKGHAIDFSPERGIQEVLALPREPRQLGWIAAGGALWYLATDTSLYAFAGGQNIRLGEGRYNALAVSTTGRLAAVRDIAMDDVQVSGTEQVAWQRRRAGFGGQVAGFGPGDALVLLDRGAWRKGEAPPESRILLVAPDGAEAVFLSGPFVLSATNGHDLALLRRGASGELSVEVMALPGGAGDRPKGR